MTFIEQKKMEIYILFMINISITPQNKPLIMFF